MAQDERTEAQLGNRYPKKEGHPRFDGSLLWPRLLCILVRVGLRFRLA